MSNGETSNPSKQPSKTPSIAPTLQPSTVIPSVKPVHTPGPTYPSLWINITESQKLFTSKDKNLTTTSMLYTLGINLALFVFFLVFFETNRKYKQIYLKRYQARFIDIGQVPPQPPDYMFGWLVAIWRVPEVDVLHMVGLDAYMLLRYQVICIK